VHRLFRRRYFLFCKEEKDHKNGGMNDPPPPEIMGLIPGSAIPDFDLGGFHLLTMIQ
jgi:hypothetical protein